MADRSVSARRALAQPDDIELARGIGMVGAVDLENAYDVVIVGAGPAGLPTAVYAGSEGLSVLVWVIVRGTGLKASMSRYLIDRIAALPNVELLTETRITALEGKEGLLEAVGWTDAAGTETRRAVRNFFLFIGAQPNTDWLAGSGIAPLTAKGSYRHAKTLDQAPVCSRPADTVSSPLPTSARDRSSAWPQLRGKAHR